jgi:multiple sugar transport system substrate-binding protein
MLAGFACAGRRSEKAGEATAIIFKHAKHPRYAYLGKLIEQFEQENPGIRVREEVLPASTDEQHQFYVMNLAARSPDFDVLDMDVIWIQEFARAGWISELTPYVPAKELSRLNRAALQADWQNEKLYAVPWFVDGGVLYYRKDLLEKYGLSPPKTFPELVKIARTILNGEADPRLLGFVWQGMQYEGLVCAALEMIRGNGGDVLRKNGELALTDTATLDALHFMSDLVRRDGVTPPLVTTLNEEAARHIFQSGRAIFMRNWPYAWNLLNKPNSPMAGRAGLTAIPHFAGHASAPTLGGFHLGVNAFSPHQEQAREFVRFMIRENVQKQNFLNVGVLPAHADVYQDPEVKRAFPFPPELLNILEQVQPRPVTPYYLMISQILQPELSAVVAGVRSPEEAMRNAESQIKHLERQR